MTVKGPMAWRIRAYQIAHTFRWFHDNGVLIGIELSMPILQFTPQTMQVDRMFHHGVVDEHEAYPLTELQFNRLGA